MESIVAINITNNGKLINKDNIPICFYWDGDGNLDDVIKSKQEFMDFLLSNAINFESYSSSRISYFYYDSNDESKFVSKNVSIQDWISLMDLDKSNKLYIDYIIYYFNYLYNCSYKTDFDFKAKDIKDDINIIYNLIKTKYPQKIAKDTVIGYIRSELQNKGLSQNNIEFITLKIKEIIKDEM